MQTVSGAFTTAAAAAKRQIAHGALIAWQKAINSSYSFFTINVSKIGGADIIKGGGGSVTFFDKYQYTNETAYVKSWSIQRKLSNYPWGVIMAQADITLMNGTKRFTPNYDGTIGAYILPDRPVKLSVGFDGELVNVFVGYTDMPSNALLARETTLHAFDALSYLSKRTSALQAITNTTADQIIIQLLAEQGFTSTQYNIEPSLQKAIGYIMPNGQVVTDIFKQLCEAEGALMFVDENGIIQFWNRNHINNNNTSRFTYNYSNMRDVQWDTTPIINSVQVNSSPFAVVAANKLWESGQVYTIPPGGSLDVIADFKDDLGSFPATAVTAPVNLATATTSSWQANYNQDGSGSDAASAVSLSSTYLFGESYRMTFANSSGQNVYLTKIQLYGTPAKIQVVNSTPQTDATSIANYGTNPNNNGSMITITNNLVQDAATANALAYIYVKLFASPLVRLKAKVFAAPHLQLGDFVTVNLTDVAQTLQMVIVGIDMSLGQNGNLEQTLELEQRNTYSYFTINVSKIGGSDFLSP